MALLGPDYITVVAVAQSILLLFTFMTDGIARGATTLASNLIGSKQHHRVKKVFLAGMRFYFVLFLLLGVVLAIYPDPLISWFIPEESLNDHTRTACKSACFWVWWFFLFDGLSWLLAGLLTAAGDTPFIVKVTGIGPWLLALLPIYVIVVRWGASADMTWMFVAFYAMISCLFYVWRFFSQKWQHINLLESPSGNV